MKLSVMKFAAPVVALISLFAVAARADVTINFDAGQLYDQDHTPLPNSSLVLLIADTGNNGFSPLTSGALMNDSFLANSDDLILAMSSVTDFGAFQGVSDSFTGSFHDGWNAGDPLALIWFADGNGSLLSGGEHYGFFHSATGEDDSNPWTTPADGTFVWTLTFLTSSAGGSVHADSLGDANLTVTAVPEPATYAAGLAVFVLGFAALRRHRRPAAFA